MDDLLEAPRSSPRTLASEPSAPGLDASFEQSKRKRAASSSAHRKVSSRLRSPPVEPRMRQEPVLTALPG
mgnify:CR=1 FL=1